MTNWVNGDFSRSFGFVFILLFSGDAVPEGLRTPQRTHVVSTQGSSDTVLAPTLGTGLSFQGPEPVVWQVTEAHGGRGRNQAGPARPGAVSAPQWPSSDFADGQLVGLQVLGADLCRRHPG